MASEFNVVELVGGVIALLLIAAAILTLTKRIKLPFTVSLVLVGIGIGQLLSHTTVLPHSLAEFEISSGVILFVFLPTLIFESSFNMDARQLRHNLLPILTLAVPGLLLSTVIIGVFVWQLTPLDLPLSLLLGSILSATDPVAVIALFKQLGAPKRLTILVEGESLFNDATAIVVSKILVGVVAVGYFTADSMLAGVVDFFVVFVGGGLVGWILALIFGWMLGKVDSDPYIEISLMTVLAYLSFLAAEEMFHVSGVMATVAAGITMGSWGRAKVSPSVATYVEHFWEYMAYVANALIFLLVGIRLDLGVLYGSLDLLGWVILAMLISRFVVIYGLVPLVGRLPNAEAIGRSYQTVMFWGGLRGAIALAIALSLGDVSQAETVVTLVMGAVLFTLLVPGLTIESLVHRLGLDKPPLADRVARIEGMLAAKRQAQASIPELQAGGMFSARIATALRREDEGEIEQLQSTLDEMRENELDRATEHQILFNRCLAVEKSHYYELFSKRHVSEHTYRTLAHSIDLQMESMRQKKKVPIYTLHAPFANQMGRTIQRTVGPFMNYFGSQERFRLFRIAHDYEEAWGRLQGAIQVLSQLDNLAADSRAPKNAVEDVRASYERWSRASKKRLDHTAEQFPEFVFAMQAHLASRLLIHAEEQIVETEARTGMIPNNVAEEMLKELARKIHQGKEDFGRLHIEPNELLRTVPFFRDLPGDDFARIADILVPLSVPAGRAIVEQGEGGRSLYLIARGVVRVSRATGDRERDLATLMAGDFFGEMALLLKKERTATCRAITPCAIYELRRRDFEKVVDIFPSIRSALEKAIDERSLALEEDF